MLIPIPRSRGFTLIEVLIAIVVMSSMSLLAWRGLDGMLRAKNNLQSRSDEIRTLQAGLAQWQTDWDQLAELAGIPSWDWDGKTLRLTRHSMSSSIVNSSAINLPQVRVVAWTLRNDSNQKVGLDWQRWQSTPFYRVEDWKTAWQLAQNWGQLSDPSTRSGETSVYPLSKWQLFIHKDGDWTPPLLANTTTLPNRAPDGVRLMLTLDAGPAGDGVINLDWVRPTLSGTTR